MYIHATAFGNRGRQDGVAGLSLCPDTIIIHDTVLEGEDCAYTFIEYIISAMKTCSLVDECSTPVGIARQSLRRVLAHSD